LYCYDGIFYKTQESKSNTSTYGIEVIVNESTWNFGIYERKEDPFIRSFNN